MIVGLLKNKLQVSIFTLLLICLALFAYSFVIPASYNEVYNVSDNLLYHLIFQGFANSPVFNAFFNLLLILLGSFFISYLTTENEIVKKDNFLPAFIYLLFSYSAVTSNQLQPLLIANLLVLISLRFLYNSYRNENALSDSFGAGFLLTLASSFYTYYILIIPIGIIALLILKSFNWREWLSFLFGALAPIYIYMCISYLLLGEFNEPFELVSKCLKSAQLPVISEFYLVFILITAFLFCLALFYYITKGFGSRVKIQKSKFILIWLTAFTFDVSLLDTSSNFFLLPAMLPLSIIIGDYLGEIKQLKIANTLLLLFIAGFAVICFHNLNFI